MEITVRRTVGVEPTYRNQRTLSIFNLDLQVGQDFEITVDVPIEDDSWRIGAVIGPSGTGKTSIGCELHDLGYNWWEDHVWPDCSIIDAIGPDQDYEFITATLASVGLGTVESWVRPYSVLSNGERFRADMARLVIEGVGGLWLVDEFTSVLDRRVACIGSGAFAKSWRRQPNGQIVVLSPHHDIVDWLAPDWIVDTARGRTLLPGQDPTTRKEVLRVRT